jgi:CheY-like chemotaxis protein
VVDDNENIALVLATLLQLDGQEVRTATGGAEALETVGLHAPCGRVVVGVVFGFGLSLSGMIGPTRVLRFLDISGHWDPSLMFVLVGALLVAAPGVWVQRSIARRLR